jgi:hypothetical protein
MIWEFCSTRSKCMPTHSVLPLANSSVSRAQILGIAQQVRGRRSKGKPANTLRAVWAATLPAKWTHLVLLVSANMRWDITMYKKDSEDRKGDDERVAAFEFRSQTSLNHTRPIVSLAPLWPNKNHLMRDVNDMRKALNCFYEEVSDQGYRQVLRCLSGLLKQRPPLDGCNDYLPEKWGPLQRT